MSIEVGELIFKLTAETQSFEVGIKKADGIFTSFSDKTEKSSKTFVNSHEKMRDASGRFVKSTENSAKSTDKLSSSAKKAGESVSSFIGNLGSNAVSFFADKIKDLAKESFKMSGSFDRLVRFTSTLDKNFQSPQALKQLKKDFQDLVPLTGQTAESIAKASFTIKSAYSNLDAGELKTFLLEMGQAAAGSNADIDAHSEKVIALAKNYGITAKDIRKFNAMIASSFGQALASDSQVAEGFNQVLNKAKSTKQPLEVLIGAMSALQGVSSDAAGNTTLLKNALGKLSDGKYQQGFKEIGASVFDANGDFRSLLDISKDLSKSIEGLTDSQISKKLSFLKDSEARDGFIALARSYKAFSEQVKNGGDLSAYNSKVDTMLNSAEARWAKYYSYIEDQQRAFGERYGNQMLTIFEQPNTGSGIQAFFINTGAEISIGFVSLLEIVTQGAFKLSGGILQAFDYVFGTSLFDAGAFANSEKEIADYYSKLYTSVENQRANKLTGLKESNKKYYEDILVSPLADQSLKESAKKSLEAVNASLGESIKNAQKPNYNVGENLKKNIDASTPLAKKSAENLGTQTVQSLGDAIKAKSGYVSTLDLIKPNIEAAKTAGNQTGKTFADSTYESVVVQQDKIQRAAKATIEANDETYYQSQGSIIGSHFGSGIYGGIADWGVRIALKVRSLVNDNMFDAAAKEQDSHSPSKRAIEEIGKPFTQGIALGITAESPMIEKAVVGSVGGAFEKAKKVVDKTIKELQDSIKEFNSLSGLSSEGVRRKVQTGKYSQGKSDLESIIELRAKTATNLDKPLPKTFDGIAAELKNLNRENEKWLSIQEKIEDSLQTMWGIYEDIKPIIASENDLDLTLTPNEYGGRGSNNSDGISIGDYKFDDEKSDYTKMLENYREKLTESRRGNQSESIYEQAKKEMREYSDEYGPLLANQQQELLNIAAQIDAQERLNRVLGDQMTKQDLLLDLQSGAVQDAYSALDSAVGSITDHFIAADSAANNFVSNLISGLARLALQEGFKMLFGGAATGEQSAGGGWFAKLLNFGIKAAGSALGGAASGGSGSLGGLSVGHELGHALASGGMVYGAGTKTSDSVPIWASSGEFMQQAAAVDYYGVDFMNALNNRKIDRRFLTAGHRASGGMITKTLAPDYSAQAGEMIRISEASRGASGNSGSNQPPIINNYNTFKANENGKFSSASALQTAKQYADVQSNALRRT